MEEIRRCDYCGELISPDDVAPVNINEDGHPRQCYYHNRHREDCLEQLISYLSEELPKAA